MTNSNNVQSNIDINEIRKKLDSRNSQKRLEAVLKIKEINQVKTNNLLIEFLNIEKDADIRESIIISLYDINHPDLFKVVKEVYFNPEEKDYVKARAIWALNNVNTINAYDFLLQIFDETDDEIKYWIVNAFFENNCGVIPFEKINRVVMKSKNPILRRLIVWRYSFIKQTSIKKLLEKKLLNDENPLVRLNCAFALRMHGDFSSIEVLLKAINNEVNDLSRREIAIAIGDILDYNKISVLNTDQKYKVKDNLKKAINVLIENLEKDYSPIVKRSIISSLNKIKHSVVVPKLIELLSVEVNKFVRIELINTLGYLGDPIALEVLKQAKRSNYSSIVNAARKAIEKIEKIEK